MFIQSNPETFVIKVSKFSGRFISKTRFWKKKLSEKNCNLTLAFMRLFCSVFVCVCVCLCIYLNWSRKFATCLHEEHQSEKMSLPYSISIKSGWKWMWYNVVIARSICRSKQSWNLVILSSILGLFLQNMGIKVIRLKHNLETELEEKNSQRYLPTCHFKIKHQNK